MLTKQAVSQEELASGRLAYLTKNFCTYSVRYVDQDSEKRIIVEVVACVAVHRNAMDKMGITRTWIHDSGTYLKVIPERLFFVARIENKKESIWSKLLQLLRFKDAHATEKDSSTSTR